MRISDWSSDVGSSDLAWTTACGARRRRTDRDAVGRWRPPGEKSTALVTPAGHARLKSELDDLWRVRRPEVVRALAAAAAEGDRSKNAESTSPKTHSGEIASPFGTLTHRLDNVGGVDAEPPDTGAGVFSAHG